MTPKRIYGKPGIPDCTGFDIDRSIDRYMNRLGFALLFKWGHSASYGGTIDKLIIHVFTSTFDRNQTSEKCV